MSIVFDARWAGPHGIGRFAGQVRKRLVGPVADVTGSHPVSARGLVESELLPHRFGGRGYTYFSPGYTPCLSWGGPHAFTVHDLIHLDVPAEASAVKTGYYDQVVRRAIRRPGTVLTVSRFSQRRIADWAGVDPDRITVVGNGVDASFSPDGARKQGPWPYLLHVGNTKPHKNLPRVLQALAGVPDIHLVCSSAPDTALIALARQLGCDDRLHFLSSIPEKDLPAFYRGATAVVIASLYEGFGLPALEGMACGVPVVASTTTALAEVVQGAGVGIDPDDVTSIRDGIEKAIGDDEVRTLLIEAGPKRAAEFSWDRVGTAVVDALGSTA
ncbi:glycosyltransferase family 4 protein [Aestuariimicrobium sp. Y1814]|uniref:glycosyltransferase family 4 protein n=1 Tax=Aestuariimicrobium sp. Y1814 TaxID=3418742 RepID=UPI003DA78292